MYETVRMGACKPHGELYEKREQGEGGCTGLKRGGQW